MKLRTHTCKATGCQHVISAGLLMCPDHWAMVPAAIQRDVIAARRRWAAGERNTGYRDAVARAVAAVQEKQERKVAANAGPSGSLFT